MEMDLKEILQKQLEEFFKERDLTKTIRPDQKRIQEDCTKIASRTLKLLNTRNMAGGGPTEDLKRTGAKSVGGRPEGFGKTFTAKPPEEHHSLEAPLMKEEKPFLDKNDIEKQYPAQEVCDSLKKIKQILCDKDKKILRLTEEKLKQQEGEKKPPSQSIPTSQSAKDNKKQEIGRSDISSTKVENKPPAESTQHSKATDKQGKCDSSTSSSKTEKQPSAAGCAHSQTTEATEQQETVGNGKTSDKASRQKPDRGIQAPPEQKIKRPKTDESTGEKHQSDEDFSALLTRLQEHFDVRNTALGHYEKECERLLMRVDEAYKDATERANAIETSLNLLHEKNVECENSLEEKETELSGLHEQMNQLLEEKKLLSDSYKQLDKDFRKQNATIETLNQKIEDAKKNFIKETDVLKKERDDYRDRFSKMAGDKLAEKNADIADLSDPNRAMKLAEKFGGVYDDEWTDAYTSFCERKIPKKHALKILLQILQMCYSTCEDTAAEQLKSLTAAVVFPAKTFGQATKEMPSGLKGLPRLGSKNEKILSNARRQMWESSVDVVRQLLVEKTKEWITKEVGPEAFDCAKPYVEKCAEICWLMVIHDPPVCMKTEAAPDEKMDPSVYTPYSATGQKVDFIVWPPLYNGKGGGLLSKGVVETIKTVTKDKKK